VRVRPGETQRAYEWPVIFWIQPALKKIRNADNYSYFAMICWLMDEGYTLRPGNSWDPFETWKLRTYTEYEDLLAKKVTQAKQLLEHLPQNEAAVPYSYAILVDFV